MILLEFLSIAALSMLIIMHYFLDLINEKVHYYAQKASEPRLIFFYSVWRSIIGAVINAADMERLALEKVDQCFGL